MGMQRIAAFRMTVADGCTACLDCACKVISMCVYGQGAYADGHGVDHAKGIIGLMSHLEYAFRKGNPCDFATVCYPECKCPTDCCKQSGAFIFGGEDLLYGPV